MRSVVGEISIDSVIAFEGLGLRNCGMDVIEEVGEKEWNGP